MNGLLQDSKGHYSTMRVAVLACIALGTITALGGLVGWFLGEPDAILMVGTGEGFMTLALGAKTLQKQIEEKKS